MDIYISITNKIIEQLENGVNPWSKPWKVFGRVAKPLQINGQSYSETNIIIPLKIIDVFVNNTQANIQYGYIQPLYIPEVDIIKIPNFECFRDRESYAITLLHELVHWTGHSKRLSRKFNQLRWGDEGYAMEELIAELGSAFLYGDLLTAQLKESHANYISSWFKILKKDKKAIFSAACLLCNSCSRIFA